MPNTALPANLQAELGKALSRLPGESASRREFPGFCIITTAAIVEDGSRIGVVAGRPLWAGRGANQLPAETGALLAQGLQLMGPQMLLDCRGTFAVFSYDRAVHRLALATDRLGVWPVYWHVGDEVVTFASALRILESCPSLRLSVDLRGAVESATFGFSMADRTPYACTYRARPAEVIRFDGSAVERRLYFDWSTCGGTIPVNQETLCELYQRFQAGIDLRLDGRSPVRAFLSGGLDSRVVAASLAARGVPLVTYNMSWEGSLDRAIGRQFAARIRTDHREFVMPFDFQGEDWPWKTAEILRSELLAAGEGAESPPPVWAGEGGSVGVGRVFVSEPMLPPLRRNDVAGAISKFLSANPAGAPGRSLRSGVRAWVDDIPRQAIREELLAVHPTEPGQRVFLFLLLNDQRRHTTGYFEDLDLNGVEYILPFYDAEFLSFSAAMQLDQCLYHRMYNRWTELFPAVVREVPWQHYPGHQPSPAALPGEGRSGWEMADPAVQARRSRRLQRSMALAASDAFPGEVVDWKRYRLQLELHRRGLRDCSHLFEFTAHLERCWRVTHGRWV
jgi:hypothetical protein